MTKISVFVNAPNKSFFGLDKGGSHSFTIPTNVKEQMIDLYNLGEGHLQNRVTLVIEGQDYPADIRMGRILNIRPHRISDRKIGCVLKLQWAKFPHTRDAMGSFFSDAKEIVLQGEKNQSYSANFTHLDNDRFDVSLVVE